MVATSSSHPRKATLATRRATPASPRCEPCPCWAWPVSGDTCASPGLPLRFDSLAVRGQVHPGAGTPSLFRSRKPGLGDES